MFLSKTYICPEMGQKKVKGENEKKVSYMDREFP